MPLKRQIDDEKKGRTPDYYNSREGVAVWINVDKNGDQYLSIKIPILGISVNCFPHKEPKQEQ